MKQPMNLVAFCYISLRNYNLFKILEVLTSFFYILRVLLTTTTIIETIKVPQIATKTIIIRPRGVLGK